MSFMRCRYKNPSSDSWKALHSWMATTTSMVFRQPTWLSKINRLTLPKSLWALQTSWKCNFRRFLIARTWVGWSRISRQFHGKVVDPKRQTQTVEVVPFGQNYCTSTVLYMFCGVTAADSESWPPKAGPHPAHGREWESASATAPRRRFYPLGQFTINWGDWNLAGNET